MSTRPDSFGPARGGDVMAIDEHELQSVSDLTLEELDRDGAIRDAVEQVSGETRAAFLGKAAVGGAALLGALAAPGVGQASAASDVAILNYALTLEYLQAAFYTETERLGAVGGELKPVPRQLGAVERAHVDAIKKALGRAAVKSPGFQLPRSDRGRLEVSADSRRLRGPCGGGLQGPGGTHQVARSARSRHLDPLRRGSARRLDAVPRRGDACCGCV